MKLVFNLIFVGIIALITLPSVWAGDEIVDYLSNIIYQDCQGQDIYLREGMFSVTTIQGEKTPLEVLSQPTSDDIKEIIKLIVANEPYSLNMGGGKEELLHCGNRKLEVNLMTYYWTGERVDPFIYNINQITQKIEKNFDKYIENYIEQEGEGPKSAVIGSESKSEATEINTFSKNQILVGFFITIAFTLSFSYYFFSHRQKE